MWSGKERGGVFIRGTHYLAQLVHTREQVGLSLWRFGYFNALLDSKHEHYTARGTRTHEGRAHTHNGAASPK